MIGFNLQTSIFRRPGLQPWKSLTPEIVLKCIFRATSVIIFPGKYWRISRSSKLFWVFHVNWHQVLTRWAVSTGTYIDHSLLSWETSLSSPSFWSCTGLCCRRSSCTRPGSWWTGRWSPWPDPPEPQTQTRRTARRTAWTRSGHYSRCRPWGSSRCWWLSWWRRRNTECRHCQCHCRQICLFQFLPKMRTGSKHTLYIDFKFMVLKYKRWFMVEAEKLFTKKIECNNILLFSNSFVQFRKCFKVMKLSPTIWVTIAWLH